MRASNHRRVGLRDIELLEQAVHFWIGFQVHPGKEDAISAEKVADAKGVRGVARANHPQAREIRRFAEELPARDERLENDVAEGRALIQHLPQRLSRDFEYFALASRNRAEDGRRAGQV